MLHQSCLQVGRWFSNIHSKCMLFTYILRPKGCWTIMSTLLIFQLIHKHVHANGEVVRGKISSKHCHASTTQVSNTIFLRYRFLWAHSSFCSSISVTSTSICVLDLRRSLKTNPTNSQILQWVVARRYVREDVIALNPITASVSFSQYDWRTRLNAAYE